MRKIEIASLALGLLFSTATLAQTQTQQTSGGNTSKSGQRNTSSAEGLQRKGGEQVGTRGSEKMKEGASRSGNSNLSPTSPTNVAPAGDKKNASGGGTAATNSPTGGTGNTVKKTDKAAVPVQKPVRSASGTRNGNVGNAKTEPVQTQGSTSDGSASVPSSGGAPGTRTKETRSVPPKSRAAAMASNAKSQSASAAGQATTTSKTGSNGMASKGSSNQSLTNRGQKEGSYSDAAKRNKTTEGPSKDPLKTGPNGQQTGPKKN